jgi:Family of unknown function (DUF5689)
MIMKKIMLPVIAILALLAIGMGSCVKQKFDAPPDGSSYDPNIPVNNTILALKSLYNGSPVMIDSDYVIAGVVTADDRSGCFYKQIIIQDTTSGIVILLGRSSGLYTDYPIGRKIYVRCKGLYLGAYGGFIQLGYTPDITNSLSDIPSALIPKFIVKANTGNVVSPVSVTISQLSSVTTAAKMLGTLIRIDSAEFVQAEVNSPYAQDPSIASGTDRHLEDCAGKTIVVRMSGYANFRNVLIPTGKGPLTAIYSRYNSTPQLLIRDTFDVNMRAPRCGGVVIQPSVDIKIDSLRKLYNTSGIILGSYKIHGVVISSYADSNMSKGSIYMQDESGRGINVYYGGTIAYKLGDSLSVDVAGDSLIVYKGILEVKKVAAKTTTLGTAKSVTPAIVTLAQLTADMNNAIYKERVYESTLVKVVGCTISGTPTTYGDATNTGRTITDAALTTYILYCRNAPPYNTTTYLPGILSITGISSKYNTTNQLLIRKISLDIQ